VSRQTQFLNVVDRDEAQRRFQAAIRLEPLGEELVALADALGRVLVRDVVAEVDVPSFDRSNYDGFAVLARDTFGASELEPKRLRLLPDSVQMGQAPNGQVSAGRAMAISTGGMLPRGADAVVMVEHTDLQDADASDIGGDSQLIVSRAVTPGHGITFAGTDIASGETVLRRGQRLTSRETGVLAAVGIDRVSVWRLPRVAILSTGNELIAPGQSMQPALVYDSNARILADAVRELGGEPNELGIVGDDVHQLRDALAEALQSCDAVLLSGGTSKGAGDLSYQVVAELADPGIVVHGVALKPGKPICLAASGGKPVVVLPGFPTSAIFTFHEFVAPVLRALAGIRQEHAASLVARLAVRVHSEIGRTEYLLVNLVPAATDERTAEQESGERNPREGQPLAAYPLGKGSGSVTTFSRADGFVTIGRHDEIVEAGAAVEVTLLGRQLRPADLVAIGSHCVGLDWLLGQLQEQGIHTKLLSVGSMAGLAAATRGECDLAGIHLLDPATGQFNRPFLTPELELIAGYTRIQGVVFRPGDKRFEGLAAEAAIAGVRDDPACLMVNRNQGSGTRILIDGLLAGTQPTGYAVQPRSHNAVVASVRQQRADWGVAIESVARAAGLGFLPLAEERYDFVVPRSRRRRPAVQAFASLLEQESARSALRSMGLGSQGVRN